MIWLLLWACGACGPSGSTPTGGPEPTQRVLRSEQPSGTIDGGRYTDGTRPFSIAVPEGWRAQIGTIDDPRRVRLHDPATRTEVRVYVYAVDVVEPRAREGCAWTFSTTGGFRALPGVREVLAATCTPDDPDEDRIFAYVLIRSGWLSARRAAGWLWQLEVHAPSRDMTGNKAIGEGVLRSLRW